MGLTARQAFLCAVLSVLTGCAGKDFVRADAEAFNYGQTNYAAVVAKLGPPTQTAVLVKNDKNISAIAYAATTARSAVFYFYDYLLVGSEFVSSRAEDKSDFDDSKVANIVKGRTTRPEVLKLFGKPGGYYVYPMIKSHEAEAAVYAYAETRGTVFSPQVFRKRLIVTFDANGIVQDVEFITGST
ncbi:MAG: hypothetical protein ACREUW_03635 [Burkholderiales bacterium]